MAHEVITRALGGDTPQTYELAATEAFTPEAVFVSFDGSGAAGDFLPCVSYYTQDGKLFARAFPADSVAAGASADVSWFPGLSQSPGVAATVIPKYTGLYTTYAASSIQSVGGTGALTQAIFDTTLTDQGWFQLQGPFGTPVCLVEGLYMWECSTTYLGPQSAAVQLGLLAENTVGMQVYQPAIAKDTTGISGLTVQLVDWFAAGGLMEMKIGQNSGGFKQMICNAMVGRLL